MKLFEETIHGLGEVGIYLVFFACVAAVMTVAFFLKLLRALSNNSSDL